jgi:hypothetical protein
MDKYILLVDLLADFAIAWQNEAAHSGDFGELTEWAAQSGQEQNLEALLPRLDCTLNRGEE